MNRRIAPFAFLCLLLFGALSFSPVVEHAVAQADSLWARTLLRRDSSASPSQVSVAVSGDGLFTAAMFKVASTPNNVEVKRSTDRGRSWSSEIDLFIGTSQAGSVTPVPGGGVAGCYERSDDLRFVTTQDGLSWQDQSIGNSGVGGGVERCRVRYADADNVFMIWRNTNSLQFKASTDGGATWGSETDVNAAHTLFTCLESFCFDVAAKNGNDLVALGVRDSTIDTLVTYTSSDGGATWAPGTDLLSGTSASTEVSMAYVAEDTYVAAVWNAGTLWFLKSVNGGTTWVQQVLTLDAQLAADLAIHAGRYSIVSYELSNPAQVCSQTDPCYPTLWWSDDEGATWDKEPIITTIAKTSGGAPYHAVGSGTGLGLAHAPYTTEKFVVVGVHRISTTCPGDVAEGSCENTNRISAWQNTAIGEAESVAVTGLVGFDVDVTGQFILAARTNSGSHIRTYDPTSLVEAAATDTKCDLFAPRVFVQAVKAGHLVAFVQCHGSGSGDPTDLYIRTSALTVPSSEMLNTAGEDAASISLAGFSSAGGDGLGEMGDIAAFPIDYEQQRRRGIGTVEERNMYIAWGWSSRASAFYSGSPALGVNSYTHKHAPLADSEHRHTAEVAFGTEHASGFCTGSDGDVIYMAGSGNAGVRIYSASPSFESDRLQHTISFQASSSPSIGATGAVDCASGLVALRASGKVFVLSRTGNAISSLPSGIPFANVEQVALSHYTAGKGQWLAYASPTAFEVMRIRNETGAFDNTVVGTGPGPGASLVDSALDAAAQNLWLGTSSNIHRYLLGGVATPSFSFEDPTFEDPPIQPDQDGTGACGPLFGGCDVDEEGNIVAPIPGTTVFGSNLILGIIFMVGVTGILGGAPVAMTQDPRDFSVTLAIIGAVLGFLGAWGLGLFSAAVVFAVIVLGVVGVSLFGGYRYVSARRDNGGD